MHTLKEPALFGIWALRIVNYKAIDRIRSNQKIRAAKKNLTKDQETTITEEKQDEHIDIIALLRKLPDNHREILRLHYLENLSVAEIAFIQNIPPGTVKSRLYNARKHLRSNINQQKNEKIR